MRRRNKNIMITLLLCCVFVMTIGYAIYNERLNIGGVSNISSEFNVRFTNITSTTSGLATNMSFPSYTNTTATFSADLKAPGDEIIYKITVSNKGTLDAKLLLVTLSDAENPAIDFKYTGVKVGDILPAGQSTIVTVTVKFDKSVTDEPEVMDSDLTIKLDYGQTDDTTIDETINTSSYLASANPGNDNWLDGPLIRDSIESVTMTTTSVVPKDVGENYWDPSHHKDGSIMAWYYDNDNDGYFEVTIGQYNGVKANFSSNYLFNSMDNLTYLDLTHFDTSDVITMNSMFYWNKKLETIIFPNFDTSNVTSMRNMFSVCTVLTELDLSHFDTSKVEDMMGMFSSNSGLTSLNLSNWDTSNVTDMSHMFQGVSSLTELDLNHFDTSKVENIDNMFSDSRGLTKLNVSNWDIRNVKSMNRTFYALYSLTELDVSNWNTKNVESMENTFSWSIALKKLDLSKWDTSNVTDMSGMFNTATSLESLDISNFDTSEVTDMSHMFSGVDNLKTLNLKSFDTSKVENMSYMFNSSDNYETLDLSNFDTSKVKNTSWMFGNLKALTTIYVGDKWNMNAVTTSENMFYNSPNLKGAVAYNEYNANDGTFANYTTGYLTYKAN